MSSRSGRGQPSRMERGVMAGFARIMSENPRSDGSTAELIENWFSDERSYLNAGMAVMYAIPNEWRGAAQPAAFADVLAVFFMLVSGEVPEYLFLTSTGLFRYAPWNRSGGGSNAGLEEILHYRRDNTTQSIANTSVQKYPAQGCVVGNRLYISFCDSGPLWVYDGEDQRVRPFGFSAQPGPPNAEGPTAKSGGTVNAGGFSVRGRVGPTEPDWTGDDGSGDIVAIGGIDTMRRRYGVVWEGPDGNYSETSELGGQVSLRRQLADPDDGPEVLRRRFRVHSMQPGPDHAVAAILLATPNLDRLPGGSDGRLQFHSRIPSCIAPEEIDDVPDGELGSVWQERATPPIGAFFVTHAFGSTWLMRTEGNPSRVWWSEQTSTVGPTPESFMASHWLDVYPSTGPITGYWHGRLSYDADNITFVLKEGACHYISGSYPNWQVGTLHTRAGCAGWALVQVAPDGSAVWYGSGTFWRYDPGESSVTDIGGPIRKRLRRVSRSTAHLGTSYRVVSRGELVFWLPVDGDRESGAGFIWDYRSMGWRLCSHFSEVKCALSVDERDETLVFAKHSGVKTVWAEGRGYPGYAPAAITSTYRSGWVTPEQQGAGRNQPFYAGHLMVTGEEVAQNSYQVSVYRNWNFDAPETDDQPITAAHPDSDSVPYYNQAVMGQGFYRTKRHYLHEVTIDSANSVAISVEIKGAGPFTLFGADPFASRTFSSFGTNPGGPG